MSEALFLLHSLIFCTGFGFAINRSGVVRFLQGEIMVLDLLLIWAVTTVSLLIMSLLHIGIEVDNVRTAIVASLVLGIFNAILKPVLGILTIPLTVATLGLFYFFILNAIVFGLAALFVRGFRLRWGVLSALIVPFILSLLNSQILRLLNHYELH